MNDQQNLSAPDSSEQAIQTKPCVACGQNIPASASLCSVCRSYQKSWKNHAQYFSSLAALFAVIFASITWLWATARPLIWYRDDVRLVSVNSLDSAVVRNRSDGEIFLSHLLVTMHGRSGIWRAWGLEFGEHVSPGQFIRKEFPKPKIDGGDFVRGMKDAEFEVLVSEAANGAPCTELVFFGAADSFLRDLRVMAGPTLNTFPVSGYLAYWALNRDSPTELPITGVGVVRRCSPGGTH
jgi:hypothetical protein